jgi:hypothetical protein
LSLLAAPEAFILGAQGGDHPLQFGHTPLQGLYQRRSSAGLKGSTRLRSLTAHKASATARGLHR